ncbi:MAG: glycoside hydrolase family 9 protein [Breznakibacter sp.]
MKTNIIILLINASIVLSTSCTAPKHAIAPKHAGLILANQVGYGTMYPKHALVRCQSNSFAVTDTCGRILFRGQTGEMNYWPHSGDSVAVADFSAFSQPGIYYLTVNDTIVSHPICISSTPYAKAGKAAIKGFYYNRTAMPIDSAYGGKWARPAGHPDTAVYIHPSAATRQRPAGTVVSSPLGWYDAGDYNKYVVNSGISTYTLLKALDDFPVFFADQNLQIPESGNALPDLLDETLFNLRWVMTMQDPHDGGVYHKLTNKDFDAFVMPHQATEPRYMVMKSTAAALDYAALLAQASRILKKYEAHLPELSDSCLTLATKAWAWAMDHPNQIYQQPDDITTGGYGDANLADEWFWAATELWLATRSQTYADAMTAHYQPWDVPGWGNVGLLGTLSVLGTGMEDASPVATLRSDFLTLADRLLAQENASAYQVSIDKFDWGSNSDVANQGMAKLVAYRLTNDKKYLHSAIHDADYILGRNATGYCFVTGFGSKRVMHIHHRPSAADGVTGPIPGFLAGGPNLAVPDDCGTEVERSAYPAKSFVDEACSYSTNEIAINWNAPLVYLLNGLTSETK